MSDKLSLEHIIRNIAEGKFTPSDEPKVNLEHTIRNVMVDESAKTKTVKKGFDFLTGLWKTAEKENLPAVVSKEKEVVGHKVNLPAKPEAKNLPAEVPAKPPETAPNFPLAKPETDVKSAVKTAVKLDRATATDTETATKTATTTHTPVDTETKTAVTPKAVVVHNEPQPVVEPSKKVAPPVPPQEPNKEKAATGSKVPRGYVGKGKPIPHFYGYDVLHKVPVNRHLSFARPAIREENERKKIENVPRPDAGDRRDIEYVGRKKKDTLARNASVKNVVNEGKKLANVVKNTVKKQNTDKTKVYDNPPVIINPNLNRIDLTVAEGALSKIATSPGALSVAADSPSVVNLVKKGEYKKALSTAATSVVGGLTTATPGVGTFLSVMEPTPAGEGEDEKTRQLTANKSLAPGEGIKLEPKKVKPLAPGAGIKLQPKK